MICPNCHAPLVAGAEYCTNCGTRITEITDLPADPREPGASDLTSTEAASAAAGAIPTNPPPSGQPAWPPAQPGTPAQPAPPSQPIAGYYGQYSQPIPVPGQPAPPSQPMAGYYGQYSQPIPTQGQPAQPAPPSQPIPGYYGPYSQPLSSVRPPTTPLPGPRSTTLRELFGDDAIPGAPPSTPLQATLQRNFSPRYAASLWATAILGAAAAAVASLLLMVVASWIWTNTLNTLFSASLGDSLVGQVISSSASNILSPDVFKLLLISLHVPVELGASVSADIASASGSATIDLPLTGLLLFPALALILGGYISSASDYHRRARFSMLRGALIGPFFGVLMALIALFSGSSSSGSALGASSTVSISFSPVLAFLYGLVWGAIFGALGGWIQLAGKQWLAAVLSTLQQVKNVRLASTLGGALATVIAWLGVGIALTLGATALLLTHAAATTPQTSSAGSFQTGGVGNAILLVIEAVVLVFLPLVIMLMTLASGAPYLVPQVSSSLVGDGGQSAVQSIGLIGAQTHPSSGLIYLVMLYPLLCYVIGGRVAARIARAQTTSDAAVAGALTAIPLSILFAILAWLVAIGGSASAGAGGFSGPSVSESIGPSIGGAFLAVLIFGAIGGALGGASLTLAPGLGGVPRAVLLPLRPLALALFPRFDALTKRNTNQPATSARLWFYEGLLVGIVLAVIAIVLDVVNLAIASVAPFNVLSVVDEIVIVLLAILPILYWTGALVVAMSTPGTSLAPPVEPAMVLAGGGYALGPLPGTGFQPMQTPTTTAPPAMPPMPPAQNPTLPPEPPAPPSGGW